MFFMLWIPFHRSAAQSVVLFHKLVLLIAPIPMCGNYCFPFTHSILFFQLIQSNWGRGGGILGGRAEGGKHLAQFNS